jgi:hypothetical protein
VQTQNSVQVSVNESQEIDFEVLFALLHVAHYSFHFFLAFYEYQRLTKLQ